MLTFFDGVLLIRCFFIFLISFFNNHWFKLSQSKSNQMDINNQEKIKKFQMSFKITQKYDLTCLKFVHRKSQKLEKISLNQLNLMVT